MRRLEEWSHILPWQEDRTRLTGPLAFLTLHDAATGQKRFNLEKTAI